jgi:hypothetical protein
MGRGKRTLSAVAATRNAPGRREVQALLPAHLQVRSAQPGTLFSFIDEFASTEALAVQLPAKPSQDQPALKIVIHTNARYYLRREGSWVYHYLRLDLDAAFRNQELRIYEDLHPDDVYGDDPVVAVENFQIGSRGAVEYSAVLVMRA